MKKIASVCGAAAIILTLSACPPIIVSPKPPTVNPPRVHLQADCSITRQHESSSAAVLVSCDSDKLAKNTLPQ